MRLIVINNNGGLLILKFVLLSDTFRVVSR